MKHIAKIFKRLNVLKRSESGAVSVEAILMFPMLLFTATATFTWFDGYRQSAANLKAAYTIGDLISRETGTINDTYITSLHTLMVRMVDNGSPMAMRVSLLVFDEDEDRHFVQWSTARGYQWIWTNDNVETISDSLPPMPNQDTLILVETSNKYAPIFNEDLVKNVTFDNFVFTRPRFTNEIAAVFKELIIDLEDVDNDEDEAEESSGA